MKFEVIITGAGKGIGLALTKRFAAKGWHVIALSRNVERLSEIPNVEVVQGDLTDRKHLEAFFLRMNNSESADFRVLIHNAALLVKTPFQSISDIEYENMKAINLDVPFLLTRNLIPWCLSAKKAHVLFIGSMGGFQGSLRYPGLSLYSALKSAQASLCESLASEYSDTSVHFNTLSLGAVNTDMLEESFPGYRADVNTDQISKFIVEFTCSGYDLFNGKTIPVSKGNP
jgi:3-oxoacyl-[acyl-carrier protein] reductase